MLAAGVAPRAADVCPPARSPEPQAGVVAGRPPGTAVYLLFEGTSPRRLFIIFDGIDEMPAELHSQVLRLIRQAADSDARIVVASRSRDFRWRDFVTVDLKPLRHNEALDLAYRLVGTQDDKRREFLSWLASTNGVEELLGTPLLVRTLCEVFLLIGSQAMHGPML